MKVIIKSDSFADAVRDRDHWQSTAERYKAALDRIAAHQGTGHSAFQCIWCLEHVQAGHKEYCPTAIAREALASPSHPPKEP